MCNFVNVWRAGLGQKRQGLDYCAALAARTLTNRLQISRENHAFRAVEVARDPAEVPRECRGLRRTCRGVLRLTDYVRRLNVGRDVVAQNARDGHGFERRADDMRCTRSPGIVGRLGFEELRVRQDHAKLVVQAMQKSTKIANLQRGAILNHFHACYAADVGADARNPSGWRHSESVKIRMLPPAVLTYSTFPAAIQL